MSGLIWVQSVCKDYQQTTQFTAGRQMVKEIMTFCVVLRKCKICTVMYMKYTTKHLISIGHRIYVLNILPLLLQSSKKY